MESHRDAGLAGLLKSALPAGDFMPHGHCFLWRPDILWLHVLSDGMIALAYFSIPAILFAFVSRRRDVPFDRILLMFGTFILACGTTHLLSIWSMWEPIYRAEGLVKLATGVVSVATALMMIPVLPKALALPGLKEANERLRVVTDALPALISYVDRKGVYRMANRLYGSWFALNPEEVRGRAVADVLGPQTYGLVQDRLEGALDGQEATFEERIAYPDGVTRDVRASYVPDRDESGNVRGLYAFVVDVSDQKRAEEALREHERMRVLIETSAAAAHEINQPLTVVIGQADLMLMDMSKDDPRREGLKAIRDAGTRIHEIVLNMKSARQYATKPYARGLDIVDFDAASREEQ